MNTLTVPVYETDTKLALKIHVHHKDGVVTEHHLACIDVTATALPPGLRHDFIDALSTAASKFALEHFKDR